MNEAERSIILKNNQIFKKYAKPKRDEFLASLADIKTTGSYIKPSDLAEGVSDISIPIGKHSNNGIIACLTISMLSTLNINKNIKNEEILAEANKCVKKIEQRIGVLGL